MHSKRVPPQRNLSLFSTEHPSLVDGCPTNLASKSAKTKIKSVTDHQRSIPKWKAFHVIYIVRFALCFYL
jgi:hypothetical protein